MTKKRSVPVEPEDLTGIPDQVPTIEQKEPAYEVVGIEVTADSVIHFRGVNYRMDSLTNEQIAYLVQFPEAFPYLRKRE